MVSIKEKSIKGHKYLYAEYSFRLPDNKVKKISKLIKNKNEVKNKDLKEYFAKKKNEAFTKYALEKYKLGCILTEKVIRYIEEIRIDYKHIKNKLTKKQFEDLIDRFTVNFTYESNAIEGNSLTLKDVTLILYENTVPKNKDLMEIYETKNTRTANDLLFRKKIKISKESIIKVHKILVKDTNISTGYKKLPNFLLMRNVKTTRPEKTEEEMTKLIDWYHMNKTRIHPLILVSEFHARFERIHPFEDGNGRVGRILINAILIEKELPPLIIRKTMRISYFSALEAHDNNHKDKLQRFIIENFKKTFNNFFKMYVKYL